MVKVFEGGGSHGFRLRFQDVFGLPVTSGITVCLTSDPGEQVNLAGDPRYAGKLGEMKGLLRDYLADLPGPFAEFKAEGEIPG